MFALLTGVSGVLISEVSRLLAWLVELAVGASGTSTPPIEVKETDAMELVAVVGEVVGEKPTVLARLLTADEI